MTADNQVTLEPCPFCGGAPLLQSHRIAEDAMVAFVNCRKCGVQTEHFEDAFAPSAEATAAWNTRTQPAINSGGEVERVISVYARLRSADRIIDRAIERLKELDDYAGRPAWEQVVRGEMTAALAAMDRAPGVEALILKGVGKINGDGWKDTTKKGEIVFVWNDELPSPYTPGTYPRVGNEIWGAGTDQYDFTSATLAEVRELFTQPEPRPVEAGEVTQADRSFSEQFRRGRGGKYDREIDTIARQVAVYRQQSLSAARAEIEGLREALQPWSKFGAHIPPRTTLSTDQGREGK